jgi:hypothetical protein
LFTGGRSAAALNGSTKANGTMKSRGTESAAAKRIPLKDDPSAPTAVGACDRLGRDAGQTQRLRRGERDFLVDLAMLSLAMLSAIATAALDNIPAEGMPWLLAFPALTLALLAGRGIYRPRSGSQILDDARSVVAATAVAAMSVAFMRVLLGFDPHATSQAVREWLFGALYLIVGRATVNLCDARSRSRTDRGRRTLIVGAGRVRVKRLHGLVIYEADWTQSDVGTLQHPLCEQVGKGRRLRSQRPVDRSASQRGRRSRRTRSRASLTTGLILSRSTG